MATTPVTSVSAEPPISEPLSFCSKIKQLAELVIQIAVPILFISASILAAAAYFPLNFHAVAIPIIAIGSTYLAGFFFPQPRSVTPPYFDTLFPLIQPIETPDGEMPPQFRDAPRGLGNAYRNCAFNSLVHYLEGDPQIGKWLRNPLPQEIDLEGFEKFLAGYNPPKQLVDDFKAYYYANLQNRTHIPGMFKNFLNDYKGTVDQNARKKIQGIFVNLPLIQETFSAFLNAYDRNVLQNKIVAVDADSQTLRTALSQISPAINPSAAITIDAPEVLGFILDTLPDDQKLLLKRTYHYNKHGRDLMKASSHSKQELTGFLPLEFDDDDPAPSLKKMLENYCHNTNIDSPRVDYETVCFLKAPPVLRIAFNRFTHKQNPYRQIKKDNAIDVPSELEIMERKYRLVSFVNHHGDFIKGHYTAGRIVNGQKFIMDDRKVTPVEDQAAWEEQLRHAYLLCYLPVSPDQSSAKPPV